MSPANGGEVLVDRPRRAFRRRSLFTVIAGCVLVLLVVGWTIKNLVDAKWEREFLAILKTESNVSVVETAKPPWVPLLAGRTWAKVFSPTPIGLRLETPNDEQLNMLKDLRWLRCLYLAGHGVTDEELRYVIELKHLRLLVLEDTSVTEAGRNTMMQAFPDFSCEGPNWAGIFSLTDHEWIKKYPDVFLQHL